MTVPFYVAPEQLVRDKAEFARKGIARGRSIVAIEYDRGVLLLAENPSRVLHKISEVYDRIAFAGVGKYNEFETLRKAVIRQADITGYMYARGDVTAMGLATAFSQTLGHIFIHELKPFEVEILIAEVGERPGENKLFKISYDGTLYDQQGVAAIGGKSEELERALRDGFSEGLGLDQAIRLGVEAFRTAEGRESEGWEAAVLDRTNGRRAFRRLTDEELRSVV
ncbi:MAG: proteasome subunit alpha [Acidimicrobiia bacterium]|nr:MAG: proteasome subunit alpha [Acidimicrobiia bacterium]